MEPMKRMSEIIGNSLPGMKAVAKEANESMIKASIITLEQNIGERIINSGYDKAIKHLWFMPPAWKTAMSEGWVRSTCLSVLSFAIGVAAIFTRHKLPPKYQLFCVVARDAAHLTAAKHGADATGITKFLDNLIPMDMHKQLESLMTQLDEAGMLDQVLNGEVPPADGSNKA